MPAYTKTNWVDGSVPAIDATNLNKIEQGIFDSLRQDGSTTMSGQLVTTAGSAATPAIAPTGDANTGIFFPAADTIAFGEGGAEAMRITSTGNVGIGTTSPTNKLQIDGVTANTSCINAIANTTAGQSFGIALSAGTNSSDYALNIRNAAQTSQLFHITGAGNVGIGTAAPADKLHVVGNIYLGTANQTIYTAGAGNLTLQTGTGNIIFARNNAADTTMFLNNSGNVGIGTNSIPSVFGTTVKVAGLTGATIETSATNVNLRQFVSDSYAAGAIGTSTNHPFYFTTNDAERMRITSTGNVLFGTNLTSATNVQMGGGYNTPRVQIDGGTISESSLAILRRTAGIGPAYLVLGKSRGSNTAIQSGDNIGFISFTGADGTNFIETASIQVVAEGTVASGSVPARIAFCTLNTGETSVSERMRITPAGYLLIGYTSSNGAYPLQVNGQIFATSSTIATSDGRYKKDVVSLDGALDIVKALNPVQFSWKEHPVHKFNTDVPTVGFIAQQVEQVLADKSYLTSIIKKSECTWETETGETIKREVTRDVEKQVTREVEREITETIDGEEVTRTITEEVTETIIEQVTEIVTEPVKETHTEEFLGIAESNLIAILTKAVKELAAEVEALKAQLNK